jgi:hypothetical protein
VNKFAIEEISHAIDHTISDLESAEDFLEDPQFFKQKIRDAIKQLIHIKMVVVPEALHSIQPPEPPP